MRIGIYTEPSCGRPGGADYANAILAHALSSEHDVDLIHHRSDPGVRELEAFCGLDLSGIRVLSRPPESNPFGDSSLPWRRYRDARGWCETLSKGYDLFVNATHGVPPFCHARRGVLLVLFPFFQPPFQTVHHSTGSESRSWFWRFTRSAYYRWEWRQRLASYQVHLANSEFTRYWTRTRWGIDCTVLYPPVDLRFDRAAKRNLIISVGRFSAGGHSKKHLPLMQAFAEIRADGNQDWSYQSLGALGSAPADLDYLEHVRRAAAKASANVRTNLSRDDLKQTTAQASIFWHATGLGEHEQEHPELAEHFGIATVEAMAAGCVPIVIRRGAQEEIVQHGVSGFLWRTLDELKAQTKLLMHDPARREEMARAAVARAARFRRELFVERFKALAEPTLSPS